VLVSRSFRQKGIKRIKDKGAKIAGMKGKTAINMSVVLRIIKIYQKLSNIKQVIIVLRV
jgi:hypothetical protein